MEVKLCEKICNELANILFNSWVRTRNLYVRHGRLLYMTKKRVLSFDENFFNKLGHLGSILSVMMYVSYIPQITNNLAGNKGSFIQPLVAMINCIVWFIYGAFKKERDIPIMIANAPGILFGLVTAITAVL